MGERFTGVNIRGFSTIEVFMKILLRFLGHKLSLFSTIKERCLNSWENVRGTPENRENHKSLAQRIFPCLRYMCMHMTGNVRLQISKNSLWYYFCGHLVNLVNTTITIFTSDSYVTYIFIISHT